MSYLKQLQTSQVQASLENQYTYNELSLESRLIDSELENFQLTTKLISIENNGIIDISTESQKESVFNKVKEFLKGLFKKVIEVGKKIYNFIVGIFKNVGSRIAKLKNYIKSNKYEVEFDISINVANRAEQEDKNVVEKFIDKVSGTKDKEELSSALRDFKLPELKELKAEIVPNNVTSLRDRIIKSAKVGLAVQKLKEELEEKIKNLSVDNAGYLLAIYTFTGEKDSDEVSMPKEYNRLFTDLGRNNINKEGTFKYSIFPNITDFLLKIDQGNVVITEGSERVKRGLADRLLSEGSLDDVLESISEYIGNSIKIIQSLNKVVEGVRIDDLINDHQSKDSELADRDYDIQFLSEVLAESIKAKNKTVAMYQQGTKVVLRLLSILEGLLKE